MVTADVGRNLKMFSDFFKVALKTVICHILLSHGCHQMYSDKEHVIFLVVKHFIAFWKQGNSFQVGSYCPLSSKLQ